MDVAAGPEGPKTRIYRSELAVANPQCVWPLVPPSKC